MLKTSIFKRLQEFRANEDGFLRFTTVGPTPNGDGLGNGRIEPVARTYADGDHATFGATDWQIADEPSVHGDTFTLQLNNLPAETNGLVFLHAQVEITDDDGTVIRDVRWGGKIGRTLPDLTTQKFPRRHLVSGSASVRIRPVYRHTGFHTGANGVSVAEDTSKTWVVDQFAGARVGNLGDRDEGNIVSNTATTLTTSGAGSFDIGGQFNIVGAEVTGAWSAAKTVTPTTAAPTVTIHPNKTSGTFPCQVQMLIEAKGFSHLEPHKLRIKSTALSGTSEHTRLPDWHYWGRDGDVFYGDIPSFGFTSAGTHTVQVEVTDGINTATQTIDIVVRDPSVDFGGTTYTIGSDTGDDYPTLSAAISAISNDDFIRLRFRKGEDHDLSNLTKGKHIYLDAFGTGADPTFSGGSVTFATNTVGGDLTISGLDIRGRYDPTDDTQTEDSARSAVVLNGFDSTEFAQSLTIHNSRFAGFGYVTQTKAVRHISCCNVEQTDMAEYFALISPPAGTISMIGINVWQNPNVIRGKGKNNQYPSHFGFRFSTNYAPLSFGQMSGYVPHSWAGDGRDSQEFVRACMAHGSSGQSLSACMINIEGTLGFTPSDNQNTAMCGMHTVDKFFSMPAAGGNPRLSAGGMTLRNGIHTIPAREFEASRAPSTMVGAEQSLETSEFYYLIQYTDGAGTPDTVAHAEDITSATMVDARLRGFFAVEGGSFSGGDAVGFVPVLLFNGSPPPLVGEVVTCSGVTLTVSSVAPYFANLDPDGQKAEAINLTLTHLCNDEELDGNGTNGAGVVPLSTASTTIPSALHNCIIHTPNMTSAEPGYDVSNAPLDGTANWTPRHIGTRFSGDVLITFNNGQGDAVFSAEAETSNDLQDALTGGTSGARMGVIMQYLVTSGDAALGTAEGTILCNLRDGDPLPTIGETITGVGDNASVQFNVVSVQTAEADGPFSRGANTTEATATFAPLSGSPAIGAVNTDEPYAIDDINGVLRGVNGSIGASEPA